MEPTTRACFFAKEIPTSQELCQQTAKATTYNFQISKKSRIEGISRRSKTRWSNRPTLTRLTRTTRPSETRTTLTICLRSTSQPKVTSYLFNHKRKLLNLAKFWRDHSTLSCKRSVHLVRNLSEKRSSSVSLPRISLSTQSSVLTVSSNSCLNS